ncbi:MAG: type III pantothenate kinase [Cytophagales bacterium]|nr:type III pantothenate kinase [Cytophagales bacterium]
MILCFDFGNTRLKYALFDGLGICDTGILEDLTFFSIKKVIGSKPISLIAICSVIDIPEDLIESLRLKYPIHLIAKEDTRILFSNYDSSTLGLDRIILAEACLAKFPHQPCLCICLGTCITFNLISATGEFMGGAISPGLIMRATSMSTFTDKLPLISLRVNFSSWGTDTNSNLNAGVMAGVLFEINGFISDAKNRFPDLQVILTGGDAEYFRDQYPVDMNLAWKGLISMCQRFN